MAVALWSSLLILILFVFDFIATPFHCIAFASPQKHSKPNSLNPDLKSNSNTASQNLWCVAKNNAEDAALQAALNWACGVGGADCGPIQQGGPCYDPNDFQATATYAFNDYFRKHSDSELNCNFGNTAALSSLDPSHANCKIPFSISMVANGNFGGSVPLVAGPSEPNTSGTLIVGLWRGALITVPLAFAIYFLFDWHFFV